MLYTLKIKILPDKKKHNALKSTMRAFNRACNFISEVAWKEKKRGKHALQQLTYYDVRKKFGLSSQMTVRAIGKVSESYKMDRKTKHKFKALGAMVYDQRILSFKAVDRASILTLEGRIIVPMIICSYHHGFFDGTKIRGQADLIIQNKIFYLMLVVEVPDKTTIDPDGYLGVDLGIKNIAATSDGDVFSGSKLNALRHRYFKIRQRLQTKGTKSAKKLLSKRKRKEQRFARDINHCISKNIVAKAKDTGRGIAIEELKGIRRRTTVHKAQRRQHHSWSFFQLRAFISYKAQAARIPVEAVNPRYTSQECPECGLIDRKNRKSRNHFKCVRCSCAGPADTIAAINIGRRAVVNQPYAGCP